MKPKNNVHLQCLNTLYAIQNERMEACFQHKIINKKGDCKLSHNSDYSDKKRQNFEI